jgi:hypothetical protein
VEQSTSGAAENKTFIVAVVIYQTLINANNCSRQMNHMFDSEVYLMNGAIQDINCKSIKERHTWKKSCKNDKTLAL